MAQYLAEDVEGDPCVYGLPEGVGYGGEAVDDQSPGLVGLHVAGDHLQEHVQSLLFHGDEVHDVHTLVRLPGCKVPSYACHDSQEAVSALAQAHVEAVLLLLGAGVEVLSAEEGFPCAWGACDEGHGSCG